MSQALAENKSKLLTCEICGTEFEHNKRGRKPKTCPEHRGMKVTSGTDSKPKAKATAPQKTAAASDEAPVMLTCEDCGRKFEKNKRGRPAKRCPECRATKSSKPKATQEDTEQEPIEIPDDGMTRVESKGRGRKTSYVILDDQTVETGDKALYLPTLYNDHGLKMKYAKEVVVVKVHEDGEMADVRKKGGKEVMPTRVSNLVPYVTEAEFAQMNQEDETAEIAS